MHSGTHVINYEKRLNEILDYYNWRIHNCAEPGCESYLLVDHAICDDLAFIHDDLIRKNWIVQCENSECEELVICCTKHASKYLVHTNDDHWFCKVCFEKGQTMELEIITSIDVRECRFRNLIYETCIPPLTKCDTSPVNCICSNYNTETLENYKRVYDETRKRCRNEC